MAAAFREEWKWEGESGGSRWRFAVHIARDLAVTVPRAWWTYVIRPPRRVGPAVRRERQLMHNLVKDVQYAVRGLVRKPGLAITAVTALSLGIGLTTAMFSIVNGVVLRGLPVEEPQDLMAIARTNPSRGTNRLIGRIHDCQDLRERQTTFEDLAAISMDAVNLSPVVGEPEIINAARVSANMFDLLRTPPLLGRGLMASDEELGAPPVAVVGHRFWEERLDGDPTALGVVLRIDGTPTTVVGVMPEDFEFPVNQQVWRPLKVDYLATPRGEGPGVYPILGRLEDGVSMAQGQADLDRIMKQLGQEYPETNEGMTVVMGPYVREIIGYQTAALLFTMLGAVGLVLLVACANVANLLLARASLRSKEVAVRTAMGASRRRVIGQMLAESTVIAVVGAVIGVGVAQLGIGLFNGFLQTNPQALPFWFAIGIDPSVLMFVVAITIGASLFSGVLPAIRASGTDVNAVLKDDSRGSSSLRIGRLSRILVVMEVAFSCALLVAAGLLVKSVTNFSNIDFDFATENVFTTFVSLPVTDYPDNESRLRFYRNLTERLEAEPGVLAATVATELPIIGGGNGRFALEGETYLGDRDYPNARIGSIASGYFSTIIANVLEGRDFTAADNADGLPVAIVNRAFAERHYPEESALGNRIQLRATSQRGIDRSRADTWYTIVGIAPDLYLDLDAFVLPETAIYIPLAQRPASAASMIVRTQGAALEFTDDARRIVTSLDPHLPISQSFSMGQIIDQTQTFFGVFGIIFTVFGGVALFLATVGLYGVLSFSVNQRTHEVGLRVALGATPANVVRLVMRQGFTQLAIGLVIGVGMAFGLARMLSLVLYDVGAADPTVFGGIIVVLAVTGLIASFVPALRATRVDPTVAMRAE
jgi:predicted permease